MGSKKKSKGNSSVQSNQAQMDALKKANPAPTFEQTYGNLQQMQGDQLGSVVSLFNQMKEMGDAQMGQNPMAALLSQLFPPSVQPTPRSQMVSPMTPSHHPDDLPTQGDYPLFRGMVSPYGQSTHPGDLPTQGDYPGQPINRKVPPIKGPSLLEQLYGGPYAGIPRDV